MDLMNHRLCRNRQLEPLEKTYQCNICSFFLNDQESFDDHKKQHEDKSSPFECVICNKVMSSKGVLTRHMNVHIGNVSGVCEICGKAFIHQSSLETHMKFHKNIRTKKWPDCPMIFVTTSHLRQHLQTHRKDKPYTCNICGNLKAHEKLHLGTDKINKCSQCDTQFARHSKLMQHIQQQH
ncbi:zinc finger protein 2-like [Contarinia nasturtii]|uniref:zinc finger protein 2-like n=1 Tax=Contarinia nasturtii TaxID=265458 RepID=UPI0012D3E61C|nr:zinc finger protein 2-like [Contarinia nasturtii]